MPRQDFISDNLVKIRDHLKQNYEETHRQDPPPPAPAAEPTPEPSVAEPIRRTPASPVPPPRSEAQERRQAELRTVRRDLEARLELELAAVPTEAETLRRQLTELENYQEALRQLRQQLETVVTESEGSVEYGRKLENLRLEFFRLQGSRGRGFRSGTAMAPDRVSLLAEFLELAPPQRFRLMLELLAPLWLAVLLAALLLGLIWLITLG